ncbi:carbohydrate-binding module family 18 protein [Achaetomium macrosporum]|uniref:Carbohydrate-binding module family 18 protein n=1 Tax=Achaetomium macrosporum TaxID=79813 RepID=A0AAN7C2F4_9PEZI|nr:carbohydrate-binding module family 18 protein [Achaetomium macrosporum]
MMRSIYVGLAAAALCWTGALSTSLAREGGAAEVAVMAARRHLSRLGSRHRNATSDFAELGLRQANGQCGAQYGRCAGDLCCSSYGFCGDSIDHCHPLFDCQPNYGVCGWPRTTAAPTPTTTSTTSTPPAPPTTTTTTTTTSTPPTSRPTTSTSSTSSAPAPSGTFQVTPNGQCGNNTMCIGNPNFGPCCSQFFWCGSTLEYCGAGCQSAFGACLGVPGQPGNPPANGTTTTTTSTTSSSTSTTSRPGGTTPPTTTSSSTTTTTSRTTSTSTSASPTVSIPPGLTSSTDGRCGNGVTCLGANFGRCCSQFGYCGEGDQYCPYIVGCQPEFGYCDPPP